MQVALHNKVKSYNLTAGKSLPEWLAEKRKRHRHSTADDGASSSNRVELIQDLEFPHSARCLFRCPNGTHFFAAGEYPYRLKCYDVNDLGLKYAFNADMEILSGVALGSDYRRFALRGEGRQLTVHHTSAIVDRLRVPHMQRGLAYSPFSAELLSCGASPAIHRFSLELGAFGEPVVLGDSGGGGNEDSGLEVNSVAVVGRGPAAGVWLCGGTDGCVEAYDSRQGARAGSRVALTSDASSSVGEVRHVSVDGNTGMLFAAGCESGEVFLFDIRLRRPLLVKDHMNSLPIVKTYFFEGHSASTGAASFVASADTRSVKLWGKEGGENFTSLEAPAAISDFMFFRQTHNAVPPDSQHVFSYNNADSGVLAVCCDAPRVQVHFIPSLAPAPRWAAFLDVLTEDLDERQRHADGSSAADGALSHNNADSEVTVYDDYTFIPQEEMEKLGITATDLAGGAVRPAMHGAFVENRLYRELRAVVRPTEYADYLQSSARGRRARQEQERISKFRRVDKSGALESENPNNTNNDSSALGVEAARSDPRFAGKLGAAGGLFSVDTANPEYAKLLKTVEKRRLEASERQRRHEAGLFTIVPDETEDDLHNNNNNEAAEGGEMDEESKGVLRHLRSVKTSGKLKRVRSSQPTAEDEQEGDEDDEGRRAAEPGSGGRRAVTMMEAGSDLYMSSTKKVHQARKKQRAEKLSLEERLAKARKQKRK